MLFAYADMTVGWLQSTKANLEKQRKTNAKCAREQRQALQMTYQVSTVDGPLTLAVTSAGSF